MVNDLELAKQRNEYDKSKLTENDLPSNPIIGVKKWVDFAIKENAIEPTAMNLATVNGNMEPNIRTVLLKDIVNNNAFVFYTNYNSAKGAEMEKFENVCLHFFWPELQRQIRIKGKSCKVNPELSDAYFNLRPKESRVGACISPQSQRIESREFLENEYLQMMKLENIKRPEHWGGYKVEPWYIEFWQGRLNRIHDRIVFEKEQNDWKSYRIAP